MSYTSVSDTAQVDTSIHRIISIHKSTTTFTVQVGLKHLSHKLAKNQQFHGCIHFLLDPTLQQRSQVINTKLQRHENSEGLDPVKPDLMVWWLSFNPSEKMLKSNIGSFPSNMG